MLSMQKPAQRLARHCIWLLLAVLEDLQELSGTDPMATALAGAGRCTSKKAPRGSGVHALYWLSLVPLTLTWSWNRPKTLSH